MTHKLITVQCPNCLKWRAIHSPGGEGRLPQYCLQCSRHARRNEGPRKRERQCSRCGVVEGGEILHEVLTKVSGKLLCQECKEVRPCVPMCGTSRPATTSPSSPAPAKAAASNGSS